MVLGRPEQTVPAQARELAAQRAGRQRPGAADVRRAGQQIVQQQARPPLPGRDTVSRAERQHEAKRPDQVGSVAQQPAALVQRFVDQVKFAVFEVAQAAVDQLRRHAAGAAGEVALVDQADAQAAQRRVQRHAGASNAAAEDEEVQYAIRQYVDIAVHAVIVARRKRSDTKTVRLLGTILSSRILSFLSFPRSAWGRTSGTLCVPSTSRPGTGRRASPRGFPRGAWEPGEKECFGP